jgi:hypothetical protein
MADSESVLMVYRDIDNGIRAIWKRTTCMVPNMRGGIRRFHQKKAAPSGTTAACWSNYMRKKWAVVNEKGPDERINGTV